jgi:protein-tyrosine phosphatase
MLSGESGRRSGGTLLLNSNLVDIHSHVLYGLDDGARTLEESLAMVQMAAQYGTTDLVVTPHANPEYEFDPQRIVQEIEEISAACGGNPRLYPGCDFHLSYENIQDAIDNPDKYTINHGSYLLVEFSDLMISRSTTEVFARLMDAGMIPIITHPERNALLRQRLTEIAEWASSGVLVQVTAQSLIGDFGRQAQEFCQVLLRRGLAHFVASDGHDCKRRPPRLDEAHAWLLENCGPEAAEGLCAENPRAVLTGKPLLYTPLEVGLSSRKWYHFWK